MIAQRHSLVFLLAAALVCCGTATLAAQEPERQPLGALRASGSVYVDALSVTAEVTIFVGNTVRTGADGVANLTVPGRGIVLIPPQSEISFVASPRYFASLRLGSVGMRALAGAKNFQIQVGDFILVPDADVESAAEIERAADGSARVSCRAGSVGVLALSGTKSVFLQVGESASISAQGGLLRIAPKPAGPPVQAARRKSNAGYILLGLVAGGGGAAAAVLATRNDRHSVSPSAP